jgi:hypothetical protein
LTRWRNKCDDFSAEVKVAEMQNYGPIIQKQWKQEAFRMKARRTGCISDYDIFQWIAPCSKEL